MICPVCQTDVIALEVDGTVVYHPCMHNDKMTRIEQDFEDFQVVTHKDDITITVSGRKEPRSVTDREQAVRHSKRKG